MQKTCLKTAKKIWRLTTKESTAKSFADGGPAPVILKVIVRKGTPGIWMPSNAAEYMAYEQELLIPPGVDMTIVSVKRLDDGTVSIEVII